MLQFIRYYGKYQSLRGNFGSMPGWGRLLVALLAVPGVVIMLSAILAFVIGLGVLILLTTPIYRLLMAMTASRSATTAASDPFVDAEAVAPDFPVNPAPRRHIDVKIVE
ncbi:MAG: hypothetical protein IT448_01805 [Phycisphaerales bacterium]|nr:hypothetical protein [Phycisphaerales bacterium]